MQEKDFIGFIRGEHDGLKKLFDEYFEPLTRYAYSMLRDKQSAKDIAQECIIKLWKRREYIDYDRFVSYLFVAAKHGVYNHVRDNQKWMDISEAPEASIHSDISLEDQEAVIKSVLETAIGKLPTKCREVFLLSKRNGLSYQEVAEELGLSVKTVERQMGIAMKKLKQQMIPLKEIIYS